MGHSVFILQIPRDTALRVCEAAGAARLSPQTFLVGLIADAFGEPAIAGGVQVRRFNPHVRRERRPTPNVDRSDAK